MFGGAVVRRAVLPIAAALLFAAPALAQNEAGAIVEKFAGDAEREKARKAEAARKAATEAKAKKDAERKAAYDKKAREVRKDAEAQRAAAQARHRKEEARRTEEGDVLTRARQETEDAKATEEIRRLIEEAEAARIRAEDMLAQEASTQRPVQPTRADNEQDVQRLQQEAEFRAREVEAELANVAAQATRRAAEGRDQRSKLARVRQVHEARLAAQSRRVAREAEVARARADEEARLALLRAAENRRMIKQLARVRQVRETRNAVQQRAQYLAQEEAQHQRAADEVAAAERARVAEEATRAAQQQAQRQAQEEAERQRLAQEAAAERARAEDVGLALQASRDEVERQAAAEERNRGLAEAQPPAATVAPPAPPSVPPASVPVTGRAGPSGVPDWRVTVLMIMTPGNYGIRRGANIADPVLCTIDGCYVSTGADRAAIFFPRRKALGVGNTLGVRAGACRQSLSCVFRGVELYYPGALQPVDLHILKHDRRRPQTILADSDCHLGAGRLTCSRGIHAEDYVLWVVPERLAAEAGPEILERALRGGLGSSRSAEVSPQPMR